MNFQGLKPVEHDIASENAFSTIIPLAPRTIRTKVFPKLLTYDQSIRMTAPELVKTMDELFPSNK